MIEIIDKCLIIYTCIMFYLAGLFIDSSYYTQYYITTFHITLIVNLTFFNIFTYILLMVPIPITITLNFIFGDFSYLSIATMMVASNVFFYTIYKIVNINKVVDKKISTILPLVDPDTTLINLSDT